MRHVEHGGRHGTGLPIPRGLLATLGVALAVPALVAGAIAATGVAKAPEAAAATTTYLPFDKPSLSTSSKLVFAHYLPSLPISLDNKTASSDYYTVNYLPPTGEGGVHQAYGGFLRDRPLGRSSLSTTAWRVADMETEVRQAMAAGIDGFAVDILGTSTSVQTYANMTNLLQAAHNVSPTFKIMLQPDMAAMASKDLASIAAVTASLAKYPAAFRNSNGHLVVSPFQAERRSVSWWTSFKSTMATTYGYTVDLFPVLNNDQAYRSAFAPISIGLGNWGSRNPAWNPPDVTYSTSPIGRIAAVHSLGAKWMQPVSVQDSRMREGIYDEAANTQNLRNTWAIARKGGADWVLLPTWNDYTENSEIAPSKYHGFAFLDLMAYYITWFKTGTAPSIVRDGVYVTHRRQPYSATPSFPQTILQSWRGGTSPRNTVESLNFLTSPATVSINVGGTVTSCSSPAGVSTCLAPLRSGTVTVTVTRGGETVTKVTTPSSVTSSPYTQDLQYVAASSLRTGSTATTDAAPAPAPTPTPTPTPTATSKPLVTTAPSVKGAMAVGTVASCAAAVSGGTPKFRWSVNGVDVPVVTASRLLVPGAYYGKKLGCRVTVTNALGTASASAAARTVLLGAAPTATVRPSFASAVRASTIVTVRRGTWTGSPTAFRYTWVVGGAVIGTTSNTYAYIRPAWRGKQVWVVVRAFAAGRPVGTAATLRVTVR